MTRAAVNNLTLWAIQLIIGVAVVISFIIGILQPILSGLGWGQGPFFGKSFVLDATLNTPFVRPYTEPALPALQELRQGDSIELSLPQGVELWVSDFDLRQGVGLLGGQTLAGAVVVASLVMLLLIVNSFRQGKAFTPANARRLLLTAGIVGVGGQGAALLFHWGTLAVLNHPRIAPYVLQQAELSFIPLLVGAGILAVAEVFRQGINLQSEIDQTV